MRWFRFYDETLDDPKVQRLAPELFKTWVNMLCIASRNGGCIPADLTDLAFSMRTTTAKLQSQIETLTDAGLLDQGDDLRPHNWNGRQYDSDSSAERMRRYRERQRNVTVTSPVTTSDEKSDVPDTDTDTDTEQKERKNARASRAAFVNFWQAYPRKEAKGDAEKAFGPACKLAEPEAIIAACKAFKWPEDKRFIPLPATWLRARRWEDEAPAEHSNGHSDPRETQWRARLRDYRPGGYWPDVWGSRPGEPGCVAPVELLREYGL